jgi:glycosyltransferase involved in cell wall biosynthesis
VGRIPYDPDTDAVGGTERAALAIARIQHARGHQLTVASVVDREPFTVDWNGVELRGIAPARWAKLKVGRRSFALQRLIPLAVLTHRLRADVVHAHEFERFRLLGGRVRVEHVHNAPWREGPPGYVPSEAATDLAEPTVAVSRFIATRVEETLGLPRQIGGRREGHCRVHVIHNGVERAVFEGGGSAGLGLRDELGIPPELSVIGFAGALAPDKGVHVLIEAVRRAQSEAGPICLLIAGSSTLWGHAFDEASARYLEYEAELRAAAAVLPPGTAAVFLGAVPPPQMPAFYSACDVVVLPSIVPEAFSLTVLEAMAAGRPVIASNVGGVPELLLESAGLLVPAGDASAMAAALTRLVRDLSLRRTLGEGGRRRSEDFTWQRTVDALDELYARYLGR